MSFVLVIIPTTLVCVLFGILVTIPTFSTIFGIVFYTCFKKDREILWSECSYWCCYEVKQWREYDIAIGTHVNVGSK